MLSVCCLLFVSLTINEHRSCQTQTCRLLHALFQALGPGVRSGRCAHAGVDAASEVHGFHAGAPPGLKLVLCFPLVADSPPCLFFVCTAKSHAIRLSSNRQRSKKGKLGYEKGISTKRKKKKSCPCKNSLSPLGCTPLPAEKPCWRKRVATKPFRPAPSNSQLSYSCYLCSPCPVLCPSHYIMAPHHSKDRAAVPRRERKL